MFIRRRRILDELAVEYWLARTYSGSGSWLGRKGVADLALPGGSANPTFCGHSTALNPFGAGVDYCVFPGSSGNYISTPDTAALDLTTAIDYRVWVTADDYTPSGTQCIGAKSNTAAGSRYGWLLNILTTGVLRATLSTNTSQYAHDSTVATAVTDLTDKWLRFTWSTADNVVRFYMSDDGSSWSQLGSDVAGNAAIAAGINANDEPLELGSANGGTANLFSGRIARAVLKSTIDGTTVADFNPNGGTINSTYTSLTGTGDGLTWTINRTTSGRRSAWVGRDWFWFGTDDYLSTPDNANFDFGASVDFTIGVLFRAQQNANAAVQTLVSKRDTATSTEGWSTKVEGTTSTTEFSASVESADAVTTVADATWNNPGTLQTHITTRTAGATGTLNIYTDGVDVGGAAAEPGDTGNALVMSAGRVLTSGSGANFFEGLIGAIAIFRTGLTAAQVVQLDAELRGLG